MKQVVGMVAGKARKFALGEGAALSLRVSTEKQAKEGMSLLEDQYPLGLEIAAEHDLPLRVAPFGVVKRALDETGTFHSPEFDVFADAFSAKDHRLAERGPAFQELHRRVLAGEYRAVVFSNVDRHARNVGLGAILADEWRAVGAVIITDERAFDVRKEDDRMMFHMHLTQADGMATRSGTRTRRAMIRAARRGVYLGSPPGYGHRLTRRPDPENAGRLLADLEVDPNEAANLQLLSGLFTRFVRAAPPGPSALYGAWSFVAIEATRAGIPSKKGGAWSPTTVKSALSNPAAYGYLTWNGEGGDRPDLQILPRDASPWALSREPAPWDARADDARAWLA